MNDIEYAREILEAAIAGKKLEILNYNRGPDWISCTPSSIINYLRRVRIVKRKINNVVYAEKYIKQKKKD